MSILFQGSMAALVTPFRKGKVDEEALRALIDWQIASGTSCLVPCGTTGEAPTLSYEEHERVVAITVEQASGRVPVLVGAGSNATENAIKLSRQAKEAGAQGTLQVTPYYNKPSQEGLFRHFEAVARAVDLPLILYNVPGRTAVNLEAATTIRLAKIGGIVGIKEAGGNLEQIDRIIKDAPDGFALFSGDDHLNVPIYMLGGKGTVSVTANLVPDKVAEIWNAFAAGDKRKAFHLHEALEPLNKILFLEANPVPVKTALSLMGKCAEEFRLPLCPMNDVHREKLAGVLKNFGLV